MADASGDEALKAEALAYLQRTGATPADTARHLLPGGTKKEQQELGRRIRVWKCRAQKAAEASGQPLPAPPPRPPPPVNLGDEDPLEELEADVARMTRAEFLEWQVRTNLRLLQEKRNSEGWASACATLLKDVAKAHEELETLRAADRERADPDDEFAKLSPAEREARLRGVLKAWPDGYLRLALQTLRERHQGRWRYYEVIEGEPLPDELRHELASWASPRGAVA